MNTLASLDCGMCFMPFVAEVFMCKYTIGFNLYCGINLSIYLCKQQVYLSIYLCNRSLFQHEQQVYLGEH
jgi:hypothetical protein